MNDTTAEMKSELRKRLLATTPSQRLHMMSRMFSAAKVLARATVGSATDNDGPDAAAVFRRMYRTDFSAGEIATISARLSTTDMQ